MAKKSDTIFVVDDDKFHLEIMQQLLKEEGKTEVLSFEDGVECLNQIHLNPEIVFLDHQMDTYSGYEILRKIKRYNPNIFVVMVSAQEEIDTAVATLKHGAFDYIRKDENLPANVKAVLVKIAEVKELLREQKPSFLKSILKYF